MTWIMWAIYIGLILLIPTAYAGWIGAPYAPTRLKAVRRAFELLEVGEADTVVDLGAGDGGILLAAVRRGAAATGWELSPIMFAVAWVRTIGRAKLRFGNFYNQTFPEATIIFAFLMPNNMAKVEVAIRRGAEPKLQYVLAYAFPFKNLTPMSVVREKNCAPLYVYKAQLFRGDVLS
ncbi:MAG: hypothetical protein HYZ63_01015 [Candidatus Andersenbacteria bacterium]|nr:hypothetical protein [Candidatus Andersenbacteria bacterium]